MMKFRTALLAAALTLASQSAFAQCTGIFAAADLCGNSTTLSGAPTRTPLTSILSRGVGVTATTDTWSWLPPNKTYSEFKLNSNAVGGALLQMQYGKLPTNLYPLTANTNIINGQFIVNGTASGFGATGLSLETYLSQGTNGTATGAQFYGIANAANTQPGPFGGGTGALLVGKSQVGGDVFGGNPYAWCELVACRQVIGAEINTSNRVNGTGSKVGLQVVDDPNSSGTTTESTGYGLYASTGANGFEYGYRTGHPAGIFPIHTTGTLWLTSTGTVTTGLDFRNLTISGGHGLAFKNATAVSSQNAAASSTIKMMQLDSSNRLSFYDGVLLFNAAGNVVGTNPFVVNQNGMTVVSPTQTVLHLVGGNETNTTQLIDSFSTAAGVSTISYRRARGPGTAFTAAQSTDALGFQLFAGANAANTWGGSSAAIGARATENFTSTALGTKIQMYTTANTTTALTERFVLSGAGGLSIGDSTESAVGVINALTGFKVNNAAATAGNVLRGNGTNFVASTLAASDLSNGVSGSGAVALVSSPAFTTPSLGAATATSINFGGSTCSSYVAGTWTPTITTDATVGTPVYSLQVASYEQVCRRVSARFVVALSSWGGAPTGNVFLGGLPVAAANVTNDFGYCYVQSYQVAGLAAGSIGINARVTINGTTAQLGTNTITSSGILNPITAAQFGATGVLEGFCTYHT